MKCVFYYAELNIFQELTHFAISNKLGPIYFEYRILKYDRQLHKKFATDDHQNHFDVKR